MAQPSPVHIYPIVIRPSHIDVFGHVNNAKYLEIFEEARWELIGSGGFDLNHIRKTGLGPVILEAKLQFKRELTSGARCEVRTRLKEAKGKIFVLEQILQKEGGDGEVACSAEFVGALFDLQARKIVEPTPEWKKAAGWPAEG